MRRRVPHNSPSDTYASQVRYKAARGNGAPLEVRERESRVPATKSPYVREDRWSAAFCVPTNRKTRKASLLGNGKFERGSRINECLDALKRALEKEGFSISQAFFLCLSLSLSSFDLRFSTHVTTSTDY